MIGFIWSCLIEVNLGISSVVCLNYVNNYVYNLNENKVSLLNYLILCCVLVSLNWQYCFFGDYVMSVSIFYDGYNVLLYSWIFGNDVNGDGFSNDLVFIFKEGDVLFCSGIDLKFIQ